MVGKVGKVDWERSKAIVLHGIVANLVNLVNLKRLSYHNEALL